MSFRRTVAVALSVAACLTVWAWLPTWGVLPPWAQVLYNVTVGYLAGFSVYLVGDSWLERRR